MKTEGISAYWIIKGNREKKTAGRPINMRQYSKGLQTCSINALNESESGGSFFSVHLGDSRSLTGSYETQNI